MYHNYIYMSAHDFAQEEDKLLRHWDEIDLEKKIQEKDSPEGDFVFYEGPPTANAKPALHHVLSRAYKDIILRYKTLRGYHVDRKAGWDTHGLPVELQVEKKLGISGKPEIENIVEGDPVASIKKFNEECQQMVWGFKEDWEKLTKRIGYQLDMSDPYITYENSYIESLWWTFKQMWDKGLVYRAHKVVPYCTRCGTGLSSHEIADSYKHVKDRSVVVKFKLVREEGDDIPMEGDVYVLSWTTTPWTLPGNVGLAVGEDITYSYVRVGEDQLLVAKERLEILEGEVEVVSEVQGKDLLGLAYEPLFDVVFLQTDASYKIYGADFVTDTDGTGVVHTAVMYGEDDYYLGERVGLPREHTVDVEGNFVEEVEGLAGKYVKDSETEALIISGLRERGLLLADMLYEHDYPFCWRCDSPLLYYARDSWFIRVSDLRDRLVANNEQVNWEPAHIKEGRFGEWLKNIRDWAISRERYWGTPLPVWVCQCGEMKCVGSVAELEVDGDLDLHRPYVDELTFDCTQCNGVMKRTPEVMDVWFDSGAMPIAQWGFPALEGSEEQLNSHFPADYICEAIDQTRGWFYTLMAVATLLERQAPYKNVICLGHILDVKGEKMSKSKGNVVDPWEVIGAHGVDALRWHLFSMSAAGEPKRFDVKGVDQAKRRTLMILWNVTKFYDMYAKHEEVMADTPLDRWVLARLYQTRDEVTEYLEAYDVTRASRTLHDLITDVSVWYVRRSRARFKGSEDGVVRVLQFVLGEIAIMLAPFAPFIADRVYQAVGGVHESVHLAEWPEAREVDLEVLGVMQKVRDVVEVGLRLRAESGMKVRQPLASLAVDGVELDEVYIEILKEELNVKSVVFGRQDGWVSAEDGGMYVALDVALTDELKYEGVAREVVRTVNQLRKKRGLTIKDRTVVRVKCDDQLRNVFELFGEYIQEQTRSDTLEFVEGDVEDGENVKNDIGELFVLI